MATIKRYIAGFRKPIGWRGVRVALCDIVLPAVVAVVLMVVVRAFVVTQYAVKSNHPAYGLIAGDRILVLRTAYAFGRHPMRGDIVAYHQEGEPQRIVIGRITALPSDTVSQPIAARLLPDMYLIDGQMLHRNHIVGRVEGVTYSIDSAAPFYRCLRRDRFFRSIDALAPPRESGDAQSCLESSRLQGVARCELSDALCVLSS